MKGDLAANRERVLKSIRRTPMSTTPGDAMLLRILIQAARARRGIEVGVFAGYGAIHMGIAFERNGGRLYGIEIDPGRAAVSRANLARAGLQDTVTVLCGDALEIIPKLRGRFDFLFLDAAKGDYGRYLKAAEPKLKPGALVVADNVIVHAAQMRDFLRHVRNSAEYETVTVRASLEKGDGMTVSVKLR